MARRPPIGCAAAALLAATCAGPGTARAPLRLTLLFDAEACRDRLVCTSPAHWRIGEAHGQHCLELVGTGDYRPPQRSPLSIALLADVEVRDFVLEADLLQTGRAYGHRDLCLFFGFESPSRFYYTHLATRPDANAHNIFRVHDAPRTNLCPPPAAGVDWGQGEWHHVRIERDCATGHIRVYWDEGPEPILTAVDRSFTWGRIGFGSFDDCGLFANVELRAPTWRPVVGARDPFPR